MRKLTVSVAAIAAAAAGAGVTTMIVGPSPSAAVPPVPSTYQCPMKGTGPTLICSYQVTGQTLTVTLRNTANGPVPVNCNLLWPLTPGRPVASTTVGSGEQRQLITTGGPGVQTYTVDCRSVSGTEIAQNALITPNFGTGIAPVPTTPWRPMPPRSRPSSSHIPGPQNPGPRNRGPWAPPQSTSRQPMPRPEIPRPTMPTVTTTPTNTQNPPNRPTSPSLRPQIPTLTTTTTPAA